MKITDVRTTVVSIPRAATLTTSYGSTGAAITVVVELLTDEGITGIGQTAVAPRSYGETAEGIAANIQTHLAPVIIGETPFDIERLTAKMQAALPDHWSSHAGIDFALWDLKGKALGVPVYQLLGGKVRDGLDLMGFVHDDTPERMAEEAEKTLDEEGFPVLKMKIALDPKIDVARYRAVAKAVENRAVIQVDGNTGYTISQALPALTEMERIGSLGAIEQPVARLDDLTTIAQRLNTPVMADEAIYPPEDAIEIVRRKAASIALMKITKHGGIRNVQKIAAVFDGAGFILSMAIYYDVIALAAAHLAAALPCVQWPSPYTWLNDTILAKPFEPDGLQLRAPNGPGFGIDLDREKVAKYAVHGPLSFP
ncbi:MAG: enolase C-terminal domain-like protein [Chloroflexota bacterium]